jgi:hypothetical protein
VLLQDLVETLLGQGKRRGGGHMEGGERTIRRGREGKGREGVMCYYGSTINHQTNVNNTNGLSTPLDTHEKAQVSKSTTCIP